MISLHFTRTSMLKRINKDIVHIIYKCLHHDLFNNVLRQLNFQIVNNFENSWNWKSHTQNNNCTICKSLKFYKRKYKCSTILNVIETKFSIINGDCFYIVDDTLELNKNVLKLYKIKTNNFTFTKMFCLVFESMNQRKCHFDSGVD